MCSILTYRSLPKQKATPGTCEKAARKLKNNATHALSNLSEAVKFTLQLMRAQLKSAEKLNRLLTFSMRVLKILHFQNWGIYFKLFFFTHLFHAFQ